MKWLTDIVEKKYTYSAPLGAITFSKLNVNIKKPSIEKVHDVELYSDTLKELIYDSIEPAFLNWHNLNLPNNSDTHTSLIKILKNINVPIYKLEMSPFDYSLFHQFLADLADEL